MSFKYITLLVEDLNGLAQTAEGDIRHPALEQILSKGRSCKKSTLSSDHLRFGLFGIESTGSLPIAALTHVNDREGPSASNYYWLRTDPVTLWADMASVFMSGYGFADLDPFERNEIENCIRAVLLEQGMVLHGDHPERWCIALEKPLEFEFTPLQQALGVDISGLLPDHPQAGYWHHVLNEIQVALHNSPVNLRRRRRGQQLVNSVWFWGGGFIPKAAPHDLFDTVYSDNPVSRGLALINDCGLKPLLASENARFDDDGRTILIDWTAKSRDAGQELQRVEWLAEPLVHLARTGNAELRLLDGQGNGRILTRKSRRRFWRRSKPLARLLTSMADV